MQGGSVVGVLEALNKKSPAGFDAGDITLLSAFAASATIAIENARLFQEAKQAQQLPTTHSEYDTLHKQMEEQLSSYWEQIQYLDRRLKQVETELSVYSDYAPKVHRTTATTEHVTHVSPMEARQMPLPQSGPISLTTMPKP